VSEELTEIKEKYSVCSAELVVRQAELDELSSAFKGCLEDLQRANQNTERMTAELQQQVESLTSQMKNAKVSISMLTEDLEEKERSLAEKLHLIQTEMLTSAKMQQQFESSKNQVKAAEEMIRKLSEEYEDKINSLEEKHHDKKTEASFKTYQFPS